MTVAGHGYVLGHDSSELERLDQQAAVLADSTRVLLGSAGIGAGMRVLDLGTGTGQVARLAAQAVGESGSVLGIDRSPAVLEHARAQCAGLGNVAFATGDVRSFEPAEPVDAVVCRLVLSFQPDPVEVVARWRRLLRPGGVLLVMEYDIAGCRTAPAVPLSDRVIDWIDRSFTAVGQTQRFGSRLGGIFARAGLTDARMLGCQLYLGPTDPVGPAMFEGVLRSLLPAAERNGIASAEEVGIDTLRQRMAEELAQHDAVLCPPTLVGCWARVPG